MSLEHGAQTQIVKSTGISHSMVSLILAGKKRPSWSNAKKLASATGTSPVLWMDGSPEEIRAALSNGNGKGVNINQG